MNIGIVAAAFEAVMGMPTPAIGGVTAVTLPWATAAPS
jgi:hypothetical protein